jgi:hypothetical protein
LVVVVVVMAVVAGDVSGLGMGEEKKSTSPAIGRYGSPNAGSVAVNTIPIYLG